MVSIPRTRPGHDITLEYPPDSGINQGLTWHRTVADLGSCARICPQAMAHVARIVETALDSLLPQPEGAEARLLEAMRYAALGGGKRLRASW